MKRRDFIVLSTLGLSLSKISHASETNPKYFNVISQVNEILFPKSKNMPSASEFGATNYLIKNINSKFFDKSDADYIKEGAKDFIDSFPNFEKESLKKQEEMVKSASESDYGQSWLSMLLYYGFEALLSDPIYGGNKNQLGWKAINHHVGIPRPQLKFGEKVYV